MEEQRTMRRERLIAIGKKAERSRDAVQAMNAYEDETQARRANTKKLRMLRLENERNLASNDN